jgi:S1-C subfamily serine protease
VAGIDWIVIAVVAAFALLGSRQGLVAGVLSFGGLIGGAILGSKLAPVLLHDGNHSPYAPLISLVIAVACAVAVQSVGLSLGLFLRQSVLRPPPLRIVDTFGGLVLGAAAGIVVVWVLGVVALQLPGQTDLRRRVQGSQVLRELNSHFSPRRLLRALARFDPLPAVGGPFARVSPPNGGIGFEPGVRSAAPSVVRILGTACGLGIEGSGWVARPGLVVTAAHVVAGEQDTVVELYGSGARLSAEAVAFDSHNDVAVLRVSALSARPLPLVDAKPGASVAVLGYPEDGPFTATPGRIGSTTFALTPDMRGHPTGRTVTTLRADVREGNSGGPAVDAAGAVQTTVYAARIGTTGGFGVPSSAVRKALDNARGPVSTGDCVT